MTRRGDFHGLDGVGAPVAVRVVTPGIGDTITRRIKGRLRRPERVDLPVARRIPAPGVGDAVPGRVDGDAPRRRCRGCLRSVGKGRRDGHESVGPAVDGRRDEEGGGQRREAVERDGELNLRVLDKTRLGNGVDLRARPISTRRSPPWLSFSRVAAAPRPRRGSSRVGPSRRRRAAGDPDRSRIGRNAALD